MDDAVHVQIKVVELRHQHQVADNLIDFRIALRKLPFHEGVQQCEQHRFRQEVKNEIRVQDRRSTECLLAQKNVQL